MGIPDHLSGLLKYLYAGLLLLLSRFSHLRLCATPKMAALEAPLPLGFSRQEVRKQHLELDGTTDWFQIRKGVCHCCILSPCFFNFYVEYIRRNSGLEEAQAGIKITGRYINNLRYADDTTLMTEREEELRSLLMKVKEKSEKFGLKLNIQKMKIMASGPITSWQIDGDTMETVSDYFLGAPESLQMLTAAMKLKDAYSLEEKL